SVSIRVSAMMALGASLSSAFAGKAGRGVRPFCNNLERAPVHLSPSVSGEWRRSEVFHSTTSKSTLTSFAIAGLRQMGGIIAGLRSPAPKAGRGREGARRRAPIRRYVGDVAVAHATLRDDVIRKFLHLGASAFKYSHLKTTVMVEMDMQRRLRKAVMGVEI